MEGMKDQKTKIILHLVKLNDSLYGAYSSGEFSGKITAKGKFWLKTWPGDNGIEIKGQFKDEHHASISWEDPANKGKSFSFDLTEKYPEGSTRLNVFSDIAEQKLLKDPKSPHASLKLALLIPEIPESHAFGIDSLNRIMLNKFSEGTEYKGDPSSEVTLLSSMKKDFFENYISSNETMYREMPGASYGWELLKSTYIIFNEEDKLSFYILNYTFTGGAHGLETQLFTSVDMKTGRTITINELFKPGYENRLMNLLTNKLHQMIKLPLQTKLTESGYFVDEIKPNDNFYLNGEGVGFFYNHYEIAPYSFGTTNIFLTKEELKGVLK
jgi:hypothetical protein